MFIKAWEVTESSVLNSWVCWGLVPFGLKAAPVRHTVSVEEMEGVGHQLISFITL